MEKDKAAFKKDLINRGLVRFGYGQYFTQDKETAKNDLLAKGISVVLTAFIKPGTPEVDWRNVHIYNQKKDGFCPEASGLNWKIYLEQFCSKNVIISAGFVNEHDELMVLILPTGDVIYHVEMSAVGDFANMNTFKSVNELSIHRLGEDDRIIGHPDKFEKVDNPDKTKLETTDFKALGYSTGESLPVIKCKVEEKELYLVQAPDKKGEYLQVKQLPKSLKDELPTFILKPTSDFLLQRKKEKVERLQNPDVRSELEKKQKKILA